MKLAGVGSDWIADRLESWAAQRTTDSACEWSPEQWPETVRRQADHFASQLRDHATPPPVMHSVEWIDRWSGFDLFHRWLPPGGKFPKLMVLGDRFEVYGYRLPDDGQLLNHLSEALNLQWQEQEWFVSHLREAIKAWDGLIDRCLILVLRDVIGASVEDEDIVEGLAKMPRWLLETDPET
jgi:hypothetical protein